MHDIYVCGKQVWISPHALGRARKRKIVYPDQVYNVLLTGRVVRFGKHFVKVIKRSSEGSIICVGEDIGRIIVIKTITRGN